MFSISYMTDEVGEKIIELVGTNRDDTTPAPLLNSTTHDPIPFRASDERLPPAADDIDDVT